MLPITHYYAPWEFFPSSSPSFVGQDHAVQRHSRKRDWFPMVTQNGLLWLPPVLNQINPIVIVFDNLVSPIWWTGSGEGILFCWKCCSIVLWLMVLAWASHGICSLQDHFIANQSSCHKSQHICIILYSLFVVGLGDSAGSGSTRPLFPKPCTFWPRCSVGNPEYVIGCV